MKQVMLTEDDLDLLRTLVYRKMTELQYKDPEICKEYLDKLDKLFDKLK